MLIIPGPNARLPSRDYQAWRIRPNETGSPGHKGPFTTHINPKKERELCSIWSLNVIANLLQPQAWVNLLFLLTFFYTQKKFAPGFFLFGGGGDSLFLYRRGYTENHASTPVQSIGNAPPTSPSNSEKSHSESMHKAQLHGLPTVKPSLMWCITSWSLLWSLCNSRNNQSLDKSRLPEGQVHAPPPPKICKVFTTC